MKTNVKQDLIWKDIEGYEGLYEICEDGGIRNMKTGNDVKISPTFEGYKCVMLKSGSKRNQFLHHRLMAIAFIPKRPGRNLVNHINSIKSDNRLINLEWSNPSENIIHGRKSNMTSKYLGVFWDGVKNEWSASSKLKKRQIFLGYYISELEAYAAVLAFNHKHKK